MFPVECGIAFDDFFNGRALSQHVGDQVDGYSRATIDGCAAHCLRVFDNEALCALEFFEPFIEFFGDGLDLNHQKKEGTGGPQPPMPRDRALWENP